MKILAIHGSSRENGNTEWLTRRVLHGVSADHIYLRHHHIEPIIDQRHEPNGFQPVDDDYDQLIQSVRSADLLLFATPLYWYGMSGRMKNFIDRWSQSLRDPRFDFRKEMAGKKAFVIVVGGNQVHTKALPLIQQFQLIFEFMSMEMIGYLIGQGTKPGEIQNDARGKAEADYWNQVFKTLAKQ